MASHMELVVVNPGINDLNFDYTGVDYIDAGTCIVASVCEGSFGGGFLGIATMRVNNVVPLNNGTVTIRIESLWDEWLAARVTICILGQAI
jgi:hypothetical protein